MGKDQPMLVRMVWFQIKTIKVGSDLSQAGHSNWVKVRFNPYKFKVNVVQIVMS